ncbi:MAG TPA: carboxypeptidase-like regulatory domain-containing protein [Thermoanaerobaculia bacterium]|nr:carboxypeptidase-like regulatory domain-containing protein [Thermoanaerobaculia bacterium]
MNRQFRATALLLSCAVLCGVAAHAEGSQNIEIDGRVIGADGQAIAGARVELRPALSRYDMGVREADGAAELPAEAETASGADGRFTLAAPRAGMWTVTVRAAGCVPVRLPFLPFLEPESLPDAVLRRDAGLRVRVEDADGHPLPGARVLAAAAPRYAVAKDGPGEAVPSAWEPLPRHAVAGPDGEVHLARWEGEALRVWAVDSGTAVGEAAAEETPLVVVRLRKTPRRRTTVQEAAGTLPPGSPGIPGIVARDPRSGLVLGRMAPGGRRVWISPGAGTAVLLEIADGRRVSLPSGPGPAVLPHPALRSGRVLDDHRRPLAGAWVWPPGDPGTAVRSDARGVYQLEESAVTGEVQGAAAGYFLASTETGTAGSALPTLLFAPAEAVTGTVVDEQGRPVAGALVRILPVFYERDREWPRAWTRATGDFSFGGQMALGVGQIAVHRPGFAPASLSPVRLPSSGLRIVLRRGTTATGLVVDEAGLPATGAAVELVRTNEESLGRTTVAADGSFSLPHLPPGRAELRIERPGAAPFRRPRIDVPDVPDIPDVPGGGTFDLGRILAPAGATLSGRVTDPDGHPLSGVAVWLRAGDRGEWGREPATTTGADGAFAVAGLPPHEELEADLCREGLLPDLESLPTVPPEPLDLTLRPALRLAGTVVDPDGEPVRGAYLLARPDDGKEHIETYRPCATGEKTDPTDAEGRFTLTPLATGSYDLTVAAEGVQTRHLRKITVVPGPPDSLRIVLEHGATFTGKVTDSQGQPVPEAWVTASGPKYDTASALAHADGSYRMTGVETGSVLVAANHPGFEETRLTVDVADGETALDLVLFPKAPDAVSDEGDEEEKAEAVLTGHIRGLEPAELAWAQVAAAHAPGSDFANRGTVAEDGSYRIENLSPGNWSIRVRAGDRKVTSTVHLEKDQPGATLDLDLPAVTSVTGRAVRETGEPVAAAQIFFQKDLDLSATMTRHDGTFEIRLEDGTYKLTARYAGESVDFDGEPLVVAGAPIFGLEITLAGEADYDTPEKEPSGRP